MQLHSLVISEPAGVLTGFSVGLLTYHAGGLLGADSHTSLTLGCIAHFATNTLVSGHINICLLDLLALVVRLPAAAGSTLWMNHYVTSGHLLW